MEANRPGEDETHGDAAGTGPTDEARRPVGRPPPATGGLVGLPGRPLLRRPAAVRAHRPLEHGGARLRRHGPGPPHDQPDPLPRRPGGQHRQRPPAPRRGSGLAPGADHRRRAAPLRPGRGSQHPVHPRAVEAGPARHPQPGVGAVRRPSSGGARTGVRRDLRPLRPDDGGRRVPVRRRGGAERGAAGGRRRRPPRRRRARRLRVPQLRVLAAPDGHPPQRPRGEARRARHGRVRRPGLVRHRRAHHRGGRAQRRHPPDALHPPCCSGGR